MSDTRKVRRAKARQEKKPRAHHVAAKCLLHGDLILRRYSFFCQNIQGPQRYYRLQRKECMDSLDFPWDHTVLQQVYISSKLSALWMWQSKNESEKVIWTSSLSKGFGLAQSVYCIRLFSPSKTFVVLQYTPGIHVIPSLKNI